MSSPKGAHCWTQGLEQDISSCAVRCSVPLESGGRFRVRRLFSASFRLCPPVIVPSQEVVGVKLLPDQNLICIGVAPCALRDTLRRGGSEKILARRRYTRWTRRIHPAPRKIK